MKVIKNQIFIVLFSILLSFPHSVLAANIFGNDENIIWQGSRNHYFKYVEQDSLKFGKNDHPVQLDEAEITNALKALTFGDKKFLQGEVISSVFTISQIKLIAEQVSNALKSAKPEQDIIFVIGGKSKKLLLLTEKTFITGRIFYKENRLNIILGEYDLVRNESLEKLLDPSDQGEVNYTFNFGKRTKKSNRFKGNIIGVAGVEQKEVKGKLRTDWLVIDLKLAADSYIAEKTKQAKPPITDAEKELQRQSAQIAKQRREMRAEMARMRKQMEQGNSSGGSSAKSIEERIATLDQLLEKDLITQEEYNTKRKDILNDI